MKVVINKCVGGFSISVEAAKYMAKLGHTTAKTEIEKWEKDNALIQQFLKTGKWSKDVAPGDKEYLAIDAKCFNSRKFYGYGYTDNKDSCYKRNDPLLVAAVEHLGAKANGTYASLKVVEIPDGIEYTIEAYAGQEHIAEQHRVWE